MKKILLVVLSIIIITGCSLAPGGPSDAVKDFLSKYKNNDQVVIDELNNYLSGENLDDATIKEYREIYTRQYSNMSYKIKGERIDGDKATVTVEITVYDYYKTNKEAGEYFASNSTEFIDSKGDIDLSKFLKYKINKLLDTTDKVSYTLDLNLNKNDNKWEIEPLTNEQLSKLHGTYEY